MVLINSTIDLRNHVNVEHDFDIEKIKPDLKFASTIVRGLIGPEQYDELLTAFDNDTLTPAQSDLLDKLRDVIANLALSYAVDSQQLKLSNLGFNRYESGDFKSPFKYQTDNLQHFFLQRGYQTAETLLEFLEVNTALYPTWAGSSAYTINKEFYINSAKDFNRYYEIRNSRVTFMHMMSIMRFVDSILEEVISPQLALEIHAEIEAANISMDNQVLLEKFLKPAFAHLTVSNALHDLPVDYVGNGILIYQFESPTSHGGQAATRPDQAAIDTKRIVINDRAGYFTTKMREYLNENASPTKYAAYFNSDKYEDPSAPADEHDEGSIYPGF